MVDKDLTIIGPAVSALAINGSGWIRVFNVQSNVSASIVSLTITNGRAANGSTGPGVPGGGIYNAGTLWVSSCVIAGNSAGNAGIGQFVGGAEVASITSVHLPWRTRSLVAITRAQAAGAGQHTSREEREEMVVAFGAAALALQGNAVSVATVVVAVEWGALQETVPSLLLAVMAAMEVAFLAT